MGAYLSQPVTDKETYSGSNQFLEYGGLSPTRTCLTVIHGSIAAPQTFRRAHHCVRVSVSDPSAHAAVSSHFLLSNTLNLNGRLPTPKPDGTVSMALQRLQ